VKASASGLGGKPATASLPRRSGSQFTRRLKGSHEDRLSGLHDLLCYAPGASVLDVGVNHGLISFELARRGASVVHGCDIHRRGVETAREIFAELRTQSRFEVVDLRAGPAVLKQAFGVDYLPRYDIVLFLGIYHQLKEQTSAAIVRGLVDHLVDRTGRFLATRTPETDELRTIVAATGLQSVHFSALSSVVSPVEIWRRN
jgi:2-polyprenyl-3-methyl-5-hydroxy-6-metoxy-1,4-benzoquinol methylase